MSTLANISSVYKLFLKSGDELTVTKLVNELGMPKSSASRLLRQMADHDLLERDENRPVYRPSLMILELSHQIRVSHPLMDLMIKRLIEISKKTGYTSYISKIDKDNVSVMHAQLGSHLLQVITQPSTILPIHSTSTGRALLSRLPPEILEEYLPKKENERRVFIRTIDTIIERGWSQSIEEAIPGVASVSSAIFDPLQNEVLALCVSFPSTFATPEKIKELAIIIYHHASEIGCTVGDPYWQERPKNAF